VRVPRGIWRPLLRYDVLLLRTECRCSGAASTYCKRDSLPSACADCCADMKCTTDALLRPCSGHGQCGATSGRCECEEGYAGPACAQKCPRFQGVVCSGRGSCSSDGRQARCVCAAGDGAMIAAYLGEACEISVFNTMARLGNQTVHSDVDGRPGLMVLPPVLIALLFIALVLYFFRANWAREYLDGGKHMLCQIRNLHLPHDLHLVDMLHAHHGEEDAELSYVLAADASKEEVESRIADVFDSVLKETIAKVADELDDEEEDIRAVYKDHRPPGLTKNEWKSQVRRRRPYMFILSIWRVSDRMRAGASMHTH